MAFNGLAAYDNYSGIFEDMSDLVSIISPTETPVLDVLSTGAISTGGPATSVYHQWQQEALMPSTDVNSTAIASAATATAVQVYNGGRTDISIYQIGDILKVNDEYVRVTSTNPTSLTVARGFGGTTANSHAASQTMTFVAHGALEGNSFSNAFHTVTTQHGNYLEIFTRTVQVSGTMENVSGVGGSQLFTNQRNKRMRETLRLLETAVLQGRTDGSTIGSDTAPRYMAGIVNSISTNSTSDASISAADINASLENAYDNGGNIDLMIMPMSLKQQINVQHDSRLEILPSSEIEGRRVERWLWDQGVVRIISSRQCPANHIIGLQSDLVSIVPLRGRTFHFQDKTPGYVGDAMIGAIVGEYTVEFRNEAAHFKIEGVTSIT